MLNQTTSLRVRVLLVGAVIGSCLVLPRFGQGAPNQTQVIECRPGWNLISVQVGNAPIPFGTFLAGFNDPGKLIEIWGYEPTGNPLLPGRWGSRQPAVPGFPTSDLAVVEQGRGYWVNVTSHATITLNGPAWGGAVSLVPGWNLVGFPGLDLASAESQDLLSVFGDDLARVPQVWTFEPSQNRFVGYDLTAVPQLRDLAAVKPGFGYWVYALEAMALAPEGFVALPPDFDAAPPQSEVPFASNEFPGLANPDRYVGRLVRKVGTGDATYDLNGNGIVDDMSTQDAILFEKTTDTVSVTVGNRGHGALPWVLENSIPWLYTAPADERTWPEGAASRPRSAGGTVSSDGDVLLLYADRTGMTPGRKTGSLTIWVGDQAFPVQVMLDVATVEGDWKGFATTSRVGGRNITLGEVRLVLNSFLSGTDEGSGFRAVLNRDQSILFPRDVFMDGVFYAPNQFKLTTNFEMKAGDRNAPPYETFPGDPNDRDFNNDGKVDVMNPFPFGIRREITLLGTRTTPDRLEGTYIESIRGMLPPSGSNALVTDLNQFQGDAFLTQSQPVFVEGSFVLERQSFTPTKRSVFNESADLGIGIGGSETTSRTAVFTVGSPVTVQAVKLDLDIAFPNPALIQVTLISPLGAAYVVHEFGDSSPVPATVSIPDGILNGSSGQGDWTLLVEWDDSTGERGTLGGWGLNIEGNSTHSATGRIVASGVPVTGATIRLEGGVTTQTFTSGSAAGEEGTFTISDLTENDYTLYISKPGYETTSFTFFVGETDLALGDISVVTLPISEPRLTAAPPIGYAGSQPLHVVFTVDLPLGFTGTTIAWDFNGDGQTDASGPIADLTETTHNYAVPGIFTAKATLSGGGLGLPVERTRVIHVHRCLADPAGGSQQVLLSGFLGTMGARTDPAAEDVDAAPVVSSDLQTTSVSWLGSPPTPLSLTSGFVMQEGLWEVATVDLDRPPLAPGSVFPGPEDIDLTPGHPSLRYVRYNTSSPNPTKYEALNYAQTPAGSRAVETGNAIGYSNYTIPAGSTRPNRFRIVTSLGGAVFNVVPSAVGDIRIQPGRTLP
jgi:subtilisin-like proprotein convertase family protein